MEIQGDSKNVGELVRLSQIEYEADPNQPDLLGWSVADAEGEAFATLDDMLVDVETGEIPFASICYNDRCTAVPLELFFMDEPNKRLVLPVNKEELSDAPQFTDETEDVQPHIDFWDNITADWEEEEEEEESPQNQGVSQA
jgi:hypothetical protein